MDCASVRIPVFKNDFRIKLHGQGRGVRGQAAAADEVRLRQFFGMVQIVDEERGREQLLKAADGGFGVKFILCGSRL